LALEKWEQMSFNGNPEFGNDLFPADFVKVAEACGLRAVRIDDPTHCHEQLKEAMSFDGPVLIECVVDPNKPAMETPLPEHHAENYQKALEKTSYQKEEIAEGLKENLEGQKNLIPESMNEQTQKLLNKLEESS